MLGFYRTQDGAFIPPKIIGIHFTFTTKISVDNLLKKMPAELPSTEQTFTETSRLVPLFLVPRLALAIKKVGGSEAAIRVSKSTETLKCFLKVENNFTIFPSTLEFPSVSGIPSSQKPSFRVVSVTKRGKPQVTTIYNSVSFLVNELNQFLVRAD